MTDSQIHTGDNLEFMKKLDRESIDLIYLDPPFNTGNRKTGHGQNNTISYKDAWPTIPDYISFMKPRLIESHRLLKPQGSILLHCDWRTSHHLRLLLDEIFSPNRFVNHLIWTYGLGGSSNRRFARKHDDIFFYSKTDEYYFNPPMVPATSNKMSGQQKKATDILNIPALNNMAHERTGYPTQKPLALLELLIEACCPTKGLVADFFCGSGTTPVAAHNLKRKYIACDQSQKAITITKNRLNTQEQLNTQKQ